nr:hypothetical protein [Tanacetum cinerariifolium]
MTSYIQPLLLWGGVVLICRVLEPVILYSSTKPSCQAKPFEFCSFIVYSFGICILLIKGGLPTPVALSVVTQSTRQLLTKQDGECLTVKENQDRGVSSSRPDGPSSPPSPKRQKELRTNTFSGSNHEDANEHIEKVIEIVDLFHIPHITIDQVMLRAFPVSLTGAAIRWLRNEPTGSITTWDGLKTKFLNKYYPHARIAKKMEEINNFQQEPYENLYQTWERFKEPLMKCPQHYLMEMQEVILFYNGLRISTRQILDSRGAIPSKTVADAKIAIQEMAEYCQKWHNETSKSRSTETSDGLAAIQAQLNNFRREIKKVNKKVYAAQVGCEQCKGPHYTKDFPLKEEGETLEEAYYMQFGGPFQGGGYKSAAPRFYQRNNVNPSYQERRQSMEDNLSKFMKSYTHVQVKINDDSISKSYKGYYCEEKKGSYGPQFSKAYSEASQSIPQKEKDTGSFTLPSFINNVCFDNALFDLGASVSVMPLLTYLNLGLEARLMGETLVLNRSLDPFFEDYIELNDLNEPIELRRNQGDDLMPTIKEGGVIEEFRTRDEDLDNGIDDSPSYFLENMHAYRDEGMGDVIIGELFLRGVGIKAKRFEGTITLCKDDKSVTYQMVRTHLRFKHHTNEQCNKIPPLLKVSDEDMMNGISHPYQKLEGFYKGVLKLGPNYIRDAKMEEWLTRRHISVHEME